MKYPVITITREFGSGGRTIARQLAEKLGYDYYDYKAAWQNRILKNMAKMPIPKALYLLPGTIGAAQCPISCMSYKEIRLWI